MNTRILYLAFPAFLLVSAATLAADASAASGKIAFLSPANGATVSSGDKVMVSYEATLGPKGDHLHLYLDDKRLDVLRQVKGTAEVGMLSPGKHRICLTINTSSHASTGVEECLEVTAK